MQVGCKPDSDQLNNKAYFLPIFKGVQGMHSVRIVYRQHRYSIEILYDCTFSIGYLYRSYVAVV